VLLLLLLLLLLLGEFKSWMMSNTSMSKANRVGTSYVFMPQTNKRCAPIAVTAFRVPPLPVVGTWISARYDPGNLQLCVVLRHDG
jgi:hypothetical protein